MKTILCPICNIEIIVDDNVDPNIVLTPHLDRCSGLKRRTASKSIPPISYNVDQNYLLLEDTQSDYCDEDNEEMKKKKKVTTKKRQQLISKNKTCTKRSIQSKHQQISIESNFDTSCNDLSRGNSSTAICIDGDDDDNSYYVSDNDENCDETGHIKVKINLIVDDWEDDHYLQRLHSLQASLTNQNRDRDRDVLCPKSTSSESNNKNEIVTRLKYIQTDYNSEVYEAMWDKFYPYQREGCKWMMQLFKSGVGGILVSVYILSHSTVNTVFVVNKLN